MSNESEAEKNELNIRVTQFMRDVSHYEALSRLAVLLAQQAGEAVKRPLSKEQLLRALHVHMEESQMLLQAIQEDIPKG